MILSILIQKKTSDIACLWEQASPDLLIFEYDLAKILKSFGNQTASETHVSTMSVDHKDYDAVVAHSRPCAILPIYFQDTHT